MRLILKTQGLNLCPLHFIAGCVHEIFAACRHPGIGYPWATNTPPHPCHFFFLSNPLSLVWVRGLPLEEPNLAQGKERLNLARAIP